jgi:hypothetical protein
MSHFRHRSITSPLVAISCAYGYVGVIGSILLVLGLYDNNSFFNWGPPIKFFGRDFTEYSQFYALHILIFGHQLINNWVNSVVYPWIINSIQDSKSKKLEYSENVALSIIVLFDIYSEIDVIFIIMGFSSQISFVITICLANTITSLLINRKYLQAKREEQLELLS